MKLAPAILVDTVEEFDHQIELAAQMSSRAQYDFIDGEFADNTTVTPTELSTHTHIQLDADMMVARPSRWSVQLNHLSPRLIIFHFECDEDLLPIVQNHSGVSQIGVAINPVTPVEHIAPLIPYCDHVLVMGVPAGFSGQTLQREVLRKPEFIKRYKADVEIGIDGGVNATNLDIIAQAGFDIAYINSAIFSKIDPIAEFHSLEKVAA